MDRMFAVEGGNYFANIGIQYNPRFKYLLNSIAKYFIWPMVVTLDLEPKARKVAFCTNRETDAIHSISSIPDSAAKRTFIIVRHRPHCCKRRRRGQSQKAATSTCSHLLISTCHPSPHVSPSSPPTSYLPPLLSTPPFSEIGKLL